MSEDSRISRRRAIGPTAWREAAAIEGYHAHVYYDAATRRVAERLRRAAARRFELQLGRWHDVPVGPHPQAMYQIAFAAAEFPRLVPWLMLNRAGLSVLVHPLTGDDYADHSGHALWLGTALPLRLDVLRVSPDAASGRARGKAPSRVPRRRSAGSR